MHETDPNPKPQGVGKNLAVIFLLVILGGAGWAWWQMRAQAQELEKAQNTLRLQVLTSRLGAATLDAEYGNYDTAREVMSGVFDGIQNYGIEEGSLPENFAEVLEARDEVITALAREEPQVRDRLVELFFRLQIPVDTRLDPAHIIPASDSGVGMAPPTRRVESMDSVPLLIPDTMSPPRDSITVPVDTSAAVPPDTMR